MQIVLFEPEIPPNTGNIARLCAATATRLSLIEPLGFSLDNRYLKRAGLDYWPNVSMDVWPSFADFMQNPHGRLIMVSSKRRAQSVPYHTFDFTETDCLIFGPETRGLPDTILALSPLHIRVPMREGGVRSINLSTCAGIVLYQALISVGIPKDWL
ncbi:MAG: tRNA (cytidine(34)-2'-O)-methyltransferase [Desulfovibrionaceae bacterium]|nr:tRNA (cytidine(34)-2'-O)-methyltransferase [Desulfovibrionaceae bacterium]